MPDPGRLTGATPLMWGGVAAVPQRAGGPALELGGEAEIRSLEVVTSTGESTHLIFGRDYLFADGKSLLQLGTAGLLPAHWGTVLTAEDDEGVEVQVEESDWGKVLAVGLVAKRGDVTIRTRLLRSIRKPKPGDRFQYDNQYYVVIHTGRAISTRTVRTLSVTGARWDGLNSAAVTHPGEINGWTG